ncbi:MAG TPA: hypothetical protein ENL20_04815 [Candidatus Cloacimonetes bacterium]|nr:hypothetical protein [Candidatus Cloacimonadota bacterium]
MYLIKNVITPISKDIDLKKVLSEKLKLNSIENIQILRRSLDARKKNNLKYNYTLLAEIREKYFSHQDVMEYKKPFPYISSHIKLQNTNPFIIGAGPAGLFAAISLVEKGFKPYIFEQGEKIEERIKKINKFRNQGILDEESNVQFGEGGAGTFSDGKLTSRTRDFYTEKIFEYLVKFGADKKIKYEALPHLGTNGLKKIIINIRKYLEANGCRLFWDHKLENVQIENGKLKEVTINKQKYCPEILILAIGNSARDTFEMLSKKTTLENKPFSVGFRIEHTQDFINSAFYGEKTNFKITGPATYKLTAKYKNKGIYSFCMCPGGFVVAAASEKKHQVLNGMSFQPRDNKFANSGIVVTVNESDFGSKLLAGVKFQREIEQKCFDQKNPYFAPSQKSDDFLINKTSKKGIPNSYKPGTFSSELNDLFPEIITESIKSALINFDQKINGFIENGLLLAPETRTSSPIRIVRNRATYETVGIQNIYPIGEGSGYSGGIISSAADGYKLACFFEI